MRMPITVDTVNRNGITGVTGRPAAGGVAVNDQFEIQRLAQEEEARRRKILQEQKGIQSTRLQELTALLAQEEARKFGQAIPDIAGNAQAQGFLETSGFGDALARERSKLAGDTAFRLGEQALTDRDFEVGAIGDISKGTGDLNTNALERKFSVEDLGRSENLARELAKYGVPAPAKGPSGSEQFLQYAQGAGALAGAAKGTYICTHLKSVGLMTEEEVQTVHDKVFPYAYLHPMDLFQYAIFAPLFINGHLDYDWTSMKLLFCDAIIACKSQKEAFELYKKTCRQMFFGELSPVRS